MFGLMKRSTHEALIAACENAHAAIVAETEALAARLADARVAEACEISAHEKAMLRGAAINLQNEVADLTGKLVAAAHMEGLPAAAMGQGEPS